MNYIKFMYTSVISHVCCLWECLCGGKNREIFFFFLPNFNVQYNLANCRYYAFYISNSLIFTLSMFFAFLPYLNFLYHPSGSYPSIFSMSLTFQVPSISKVIQQLILWGFFSFSIRFSMFIHATTNCKFFFFSVIR